MRAIPIQHWFFAVLAACSCAATTAAGAQDDQADWWTEAGRFIRESEYHVVDSAAGLRYSNRAQRLGVLFQDGNAVITPWEPDGPVWSIRLEMALPHAISEAPADLLANEGSVRWRNRPAGVELRFSTLPVVLGVRADLELDVHVTSNGDLLRWYSAGRPVLELRSADETLIRLDGDSLTVEGAGSGSLWITGGVQGDPSSGPSDVPDWIGEGNGSVAGFGAALATAGDFNNDGYSDVIVGAPDFGVLDRGRVFLFRGSANGLETIPIWIVDGETDRSRFGSAVAGAGDINGDGFDDLLIGAPFLTNESTSAGRAYVFHGGSPQPDNNVDWAYSGDRALDQFGKSVAAAGDVNGDGCADVVIGAPGSSDLQMPTDGRGFVFEGCSPTGGLAPGPSWVADIDRPGARFGASVAGAGDVNADGYADVIVGAPFFGRTGDLARREETTFNEGQVAVYLGSAAGLPAAPDWVAFGGVSDATFGTAVAGAGDVNGDGYGDVLVGAPANNVSSGGSAHLYAGNATGVADTRLWTGTIGQAGDGFGDAVATSGDVNGDGYADVLVGATAYNGGASMEGAAFLYYGGQDGPRTTPDWSVEGNLTMAGLGRAVGTAGDVNDDGYSDILIGAPGFAVNSFSGGRALAYYGAPLAPAEADSWSVVGTRYRLGWSVATAGDFNGDGFSDILVSEAAGDRASLFAGSADGLADSPGWQFRGSFNSDFGWVVGTAGDVNGDGLTDIIFGAPIQMGRGAVFVFHGGRPPGALTSPTADWSVLGGGAAQLGHSAAFAGDVNGDGYADIIAGAPGTPDGGTVFAWLGSPAGLSETYDWMATSPLPGAAFGDATASAGDVNGDGFGDVIVGALNAEGNRGLAVVYLGSPNGLSAEPTWQVQGLRSSERFGESVASVGDLNGDGFGDIAVGAPTDRDVGRVYVYLGSPSGPSLVHDWVVSATAANTKFGASIASAGDVNGDGFGDLFIGEFEGTPAAAFVYAGSPSGPGPTPFWTGTAPTETNFGFSVATAGDVDGDGVSDLLVGARGSANSDPGQVHLYSGNPGTRRARRFASTGGRTRPARQFRELDPTVPIDVYGLSDSSTGFVIDAVGRTAAGRGTIASRVELAPVGHAFANPLKLNGTAQDTGAPMGANGSAITVRQTIDTLDPTTFVHWRIRFVSDSLLFPTSPWRSVPWNGTTETKLRTAGPPPVAALGPIGPGSNEPVLPDSAPFIFSWNRGPNARFRLEWSSTTGFADRLEVSGEQVANNSGGDVQVFIPDPDLWLRILRLGRNADVRQVPIFWRVVPLDAPAPATPVAISAIRMAPPLSPVLLSPADGVVFPDSQSPILNWQENHNDRYRVVFSRTPGLEEPRVTSEVVTAPPLRDWDDTWAEVVALAEQGDGQIYWAVFAEDAIDRLTWSDVRNFRILPTGPLESR